MRRDLSKTTKETRNYHIDLDIEKRNDEPAKLVGHAAVFNSLSEDLGGFREKIAPGAFKNAITGSDVRALFNHDPNFVLGRTISGTLRLSEDEKGLRIENDLPDTQQARDLMVSVGRGDINQMSFGFTVNKQQWEEDGEGVVTRTLLDVDLFDVSVVTYPAYPKTDAAIRSLEEFKKDQLPKFNKLGIMRKRLDLFDIL